MLAVIGHQRNSRTVEAGNIAAASRCTSPSAAPRINNRRGVSVDEPQKGGAATWPKRLTRAAYELSGSAARRRQATSTTAPTQEHAAAQQPARQLRSRTAEDIANEQTADQLALRILAATVGEKVLKDMSALMDELLQSHLLDDDDEEGDEGWLDDQHERGKKLLNEAIADVLDKYPDIAARQ